MENQVEEIKRRLDIVEFIGSFITLKKTGRNFKAVCPFHQEKTPSFVVSPDRQIWHCFGACQDGGDVIRFLMKWENISFYEALKELATRVGIKLKRLAGEDLAWKNKERLLGLNFLSCEFFEHILHKSPYGSRALSYLSDRQINEKIIKKFHLGYSPDSWDSLLRFLKKKKYELEEMLAAGLLVKSDHGHYYDRFRGRLIFPIFNPRGEVVGFSGRSLDQQDKSAKYINTPETSLYHKRETLFGINMAKDAIKKEGNVFLVEGEFDMISPYQHGIENFVAIKGSAVTHEQLMLLKRYTGRVTLALDMDPAGLEAMRRGIDEAEGLDFDLGVVVFDFGKDPDEAINKDLEKFKKTISRPTPIYDFLIDLAQKKYPGNDAFSKKMVAQEVAPLIGRIKNPIIQSHYIKKISSILDVSEGSVSLLIRRIGQKAKTKFFIKTKNEKTQSVDRELLIEKYLLSIIFQSENPHSIAKSIFNDLALDELILPSYQKIVNVLFDYEKLAKKFDLKEFVGKLSPALIAVFDEIYLFASGQVEFETENIKKLSLETKRLSLKRRITSLVNRSGENNEREETKELCRRLNEVEKTLSSL